MGLVVAGYGRHYVVETPEGQRIICHPRGKKSDCVVGDRVRWQTSGDEGVIEHGEPRRRAITVPHPHLRFAQSHRGPRHEIALGRATAEPPAVAYVHQELASPTGLESVGPRTGD